MIRYNVFGFVAVNLVQEGVDKGFLFFFVLSRFTSFVYDILTTTNKNKFDTKINPVFYQLMFFLLYLVKNHVYLSDFLFKNI